MKIEHIAMYVNDLEQTKNFFTHYFHAKAGEKYHNKTSGFQSYFLSFQGECRLEIMSRPEMESLKKPLTRTGYAHIALGSAPGVSAHFVLFFIIQLLILYNILLLFPLQSVMIKN